MVKYKSRLVLKFQLNQSNGLDLKGLSVTVNFDAKFRSVVRRRISVSPSVRCSQMTVCFRNANIGWVGAVCHNVRRSSVSKRALLSDDCV